MDNAILHYKGLLFIVPNIIDTDTAEYYYEEKTCPHDAISGCEAVVDLEDGDSDPHGIFEFVGLTDDTYLSEEQLAAIRKQLASK